MLAGVCGSSVLWCHSQMFCAWLWNLLIDHLILFFSLHLDVMMSLALVHSWAVCVFIIPIWSICEENSVCSLVNEKFYKFPRHIESLLFVISEESSSDFLVEQKRFYFDVGSNQRGVYLRISEVHAVFWMAGWLFVVCLSVCLSVWYFYFIFWNWHGSSVV